MAAADSSTTNGAHRNTRQRRWRSNPGRPLQRTAATRHTEQHSLDFAEPMTIRQLPLLLALAGPLLAIGLNPSRPALAQVERRTGGRANGRADQKSDHFLRVQNTSECATAIVFVQNHSGPVSKLRIARILRIPDADRGARNARTRGQDYGSSNINQATH